MGKKARLKAIKRLAQSVAPINEATLEKHYLTGEEIKENGYCPAYEKAELKPDQKYEVNMPVLIVQNNERRLKRAFLRNGTEGVRQFLNKNLQVVQSNIS